MKTLTTVVLAITLAAVTLVIEPSPFAQAQGRSIDLATQDKPRYPSHFNDAEQAGNAARYAAHPLHSGQTSRTR